MSVVFGTLSSAIVGTLLFITFAKFFGTLHRTFPTPIDYQVWSSFVLSFSLISAVETLGLFLAIILPILAALGLAKQ